MPYYMVQAAYTPAAMAAFIQSPQDRPRVVRAAVEKLGGSVDGFWLAFGDYDVVIICQMPNNETMAALSMAVAAGGGVRAFKTTPLLSWDAGVNAMRTAASVGYTPPAPKA